MPLTTGQKLASSEARVHALEHLFSNGDSVPSKAAAETLTNGCAAFWHRGGGSSAAAVFIGYLNRHQDVLRACEAYETDFHQTECALRAEDVLDQLLPLNELAVHSLLDAYAELDDVTFRAAAELFERTDKAEQHAAEEIAALMRSGRVGFFPLDWSRVDEAAVALNRDAGQVAA
jgi:hypothetical protein